MPNTTKPILTLAAIALAVSGYSFAPVHNIQDDVSPENFWAMWETLQEYGGY